MSYVMWCETHDAQIIGKSWDLESEPNWFCWKYDHWEQDHEDSPTPCKMVEGELTL